ncbi:MAG: phosphatidylserine decarboxylase family protein [Mariprofundaceae bacterium]|nr:phosphatidylserine decarboxylase family protein [Mariprofundaceae bacterium]
MTISTNKPQALSGNARGSIPLAPQGWPFIIATLALLLISVALQWFITAIILLILFAFVLNFFRDFDRDTPQNENLYIAPADGRVIRAESTEEGLRVDIFMNVFDVHVNRAPMSGKITAIEYTKGKFVNASFNNASTENERNRFEMETSSGMKISFTQISGLIARRIISYVSVGDSVLAGQRIGMIRFGSRVDCIIPKGFQLNVKVGDKVTSATSILARRKES